MLNAEKAYLKRKRKRMHKAMATQKELLDAKEKKVKHEARPLP